MLKYLLFLIVSIPHILSAQVTEDVGIDKKIDAFFAKLTTPIVDAVFSEINFGGVSIPWILIVLTFGAIFFTVYFKFINVTMFGKALKIVRGKYDSAESGKHEVLPTSDIPTTADEDIMQTIRIEGKSEGEVSHFQALTAALSGTVGLGNIAGVAVALSIGGPGATFWMIFAGLIGMASKFTECTLGVKYREIGPDGTVYGGPMYYLKKGLSEVGIPNMGKIFAIFFALMCVGASFGGGNMFQANQAFSIFEKVMSPEVGGFWKDKGWLFGSVLAVLVGIVIIGGIKSIAKVTSRVVPLMVLVYVIASISVLVINYNLIPLAFKMIVEGAFYPLGIAGGIAGVMIQGFRRAAFSNEAGIGSAPIAHSAVRTRYPASEGLVALLEPFIDTVIICTMTALVLIVSNMNLDIMQYGNKIPNGVEATMSAFNKFFPWFHYILMVTVILFAFSTMISWSYYGYQAWAYLFGRGKTMEYTYKFIFCLFIIVGSASSLGAVIDFSDAMLFAMMVPNMVGILILAPKVKIELNRYLQKIKFIK